MLRRRNEGEVEHAVHEDGHEDEDGQGQEGRHQLQGKHLGNLERLLYLLRGFSWGGKTYNLFYRVVLFWEMGVDFIELKEKNYQKLYLLRIEIDWRKPSTHKLPKNPRTPDFFESTFSLFF